MNQVLAARYCLGRAVPGANHTGRAFVRGDVVRDDFSEQLVDLVFGDD